MFFHKQELQFKSTPDKPDAVYARKLQEVLGGQYGEITVAMQYGFQSWNAHLPGKYRDLLYGIGAEEFGHVEMLATMIAQLLEKAPRARPRTTYRPTRRSQRSSAAPMFSMRSSPVPAPAPSTATATPGAAATSPPAAICWPTSEPTPTPKCRAGSKSLASIT